MVPWKQHELMLWQNACYYFTNVLIPLLLSLNAAWNLTNNQELDTKCSVWLYLVKNKWALSHENLSSGFATRIDSNQPAQLQKQVRVMKLQI